MCCIPLGLGEVAELTNYPYEVLMARPDWADQNAALATATSRAISRGGALYHSNPSAFKAALRAHRFSDKSKLEDNVFELAYSMIAPAMPTWGSMNQEGWQKVLDFSIGAGIVKDRAKAPSLKEGVLWTNKYAKYIRLPEWRANLSITHCAEELLERMKLEVGIALLLFTDSRRWCV